MMTEQKQDELIIDDSNFHKYFRDVRTSAPERGDIMARFTSMAEFVDGNLKRDVMSVLKTPNKALPAVNVMRKLGCATEKDAYRICREMTEDLLSGMTDDEVAAKLYRYQIEVFYYTKKEYMPVDDPHWEVISLTNLDEFLDAGGNKCTIKGKLVEKKEPENKEGDENPADQPLHTGDEDIPRVDA